MSAVDLVQRQHHRLVDSVERLLVIRRQPAASFEDLDQALDEVRVAFEVMRRIEQFSADREPSEPTFGIPGAFGVVDPGDAGVVVPIRRRPHP